MVPTKTGEAVPSSGRMEGTVATRSPANVKVFGETSLWSARMVVFVAIRKTVEPFYRAM